MAGKFIPLEQAAEMLGVTPEKLNDMRQRREINGLRDGSSWKFKREELERVAEELGVSLREVSGAEEDELLDIGELGPTGASELVLDLDAEESGESPTAVGKSGQAKPAGGAGSDLELGSDSQVPLSMDQPTSDVNLTGGSESNVFGGTDLGVQGGSELDFEGSGLSLASDLSLGVQGKAEAKPADDDLTIGSSEDEVSLEEDQESALEGGSDVTRGAGDTGINLRPGDSGLNLEEVPLDLAGSSVSSLELPEDDDIIALEELEANPDEATQLRADEDFNLAPGADLGHDEEDSGSQVIALEDSEAFAEQGGAALEEVGPLIGQEPGDSGEIDIQQEVVAVTTPRDYLAPPPEMPYSIWNVLSLLAIVLLLTVTGMLMTDLLRNMWSWDGTYSASSPIMDSMVRLLGLEP
jgi:excisionase family DNA binding protein